MNATVKTIEINGEWFASLDGINPITVSVNDLNDKEFYEILDGDE